MGRKVFVSYKYKDTNVRQIPNITLYEHRRTRVRDYVDILQGLLEKVGQNINKGERDGEDMSVLEDSTIQSVLGDKIYDSTITLVLISPNMKDPLLPEIEQWIPWEISYSLREQSREGRTSKTNGVMAIVLPDANNSYGYYMQEHTCPYCNNRILYTGRLFKILSVNMFNRYFPSYSNCPYHPNNNRPETGESSYIPSVKWDDFIADIEGNLQRIERIKANIAAYDIKKNLKTIMENS
ncbi:MAG: TIR domain-containing protein [Bacteroidales bacterium]|nr:TIR domain-containing protein [Bacteroidales bacterium]MBR3493122.1 TIR domain-containing protein [Bacteroidales bacterium]